MNYGRLIFAIASVGLAACAPQRFTSVGGTAASVASSAALVAPVGSFRQEFGSLSHEKNYLTIDSESVTATTVCKHGDRKVLVQATSPARVSDSHYEVLTTTKNTKILGGYACNAEIKAGVTAYEVKRNQIYLTADNAETTFYGYQMGRRPSLKGQLIDFFEDGKEALAAGDEKFYAAAVASRALPGAIVKGTVGAATAVKDAVLAAPQAAVDGATQVKESVINDTVRFKDNTVHEVTAIKDGVVKGATILKESTIDGATYVKENGAAIGRKIVTTFGPENQ